MRITVTTSEGEPLRLEVAHPDVGQADVDELAAQLTAAVRAWMHGPAEPAAPARQVPQVPQVRQVDQVRPDGPEPDGEQLCAAARVLFARGRSIAQVAAALHLDRDLVRDWHVRRYR